MSISWTTSPPTFATPIISWKKKDLIRAFEAVIWAWAWMEIGLEKELLRQKE